MNLHLISDLHLDISKHLTMPGGEVLVIAGDACEIRSLRTDIQKGSGPCKDFFFEQTTKYKKVFYVPGNHEFYRHKTWKAINELKSLLPSTVTVLDNEFEVYDGVLFVGSTLWTDLNKGNPIDIQFAHGMNDYSVITHRDPRFQDVYRKLKPSDTALLHQASRAYLKEILSTMTDLPTVVISHHGPTWQSIDEKFINHPLNSCYVSDMSDFILDNPNIKHWCHGHVHQRKKYQIGSSWIHCNPRGYLPYEDTDFDVNYTFSV